MFDILKDIYLFESLNQEEIEKFLTVTEILSCKKGDVLFKEGDSSDTLYILVEGKIRMSKQVADVGEEALSILEKGDYFGEMGLLDDSPRSADAIANEDSKLLIVRRSSFLAFMEQNHDIAYKVLLTFLRRLCERLRETNEKISGLFAISKMF
jgi:CRP/FNR family cyclic AMP-dependent transcriptional regulator